MDSPRGPSAAGCLASSCAADLRALDLCKGHDVLALCKLDARLASHSAAQGCGPGEEVAFAGAASERGAGDGWAPLLIARASPC
eukprot:1429314-Alexandrium_andersonii.AAC.1